MERTWNTTSRLEYVSFVATFAGIPRDIRAYVSAVRDMLVAAIGNLKITAIRMDSRRLLETRNTSNPTTLTNEEVGLLSASWYVDWLEGAETERLVLYCEEIPIRSKMEFLFKIEYDTHPIDRGIAVEKHLVATICLSWMTDSQAASLSRMGANFAEAAMTLASACSVLVDVGDIAETARGTIYLSRWPAYARFQRQLSRLVWVRAGEKRRDLARGVFWGNLLTKPMLDRLGGADGFVAEYRKLEDPRDHDLCTLLPNGSVWLTLSSSIKDVCHQSPGMTPWLLDRGAWLYERLARARLLCGMQEPSPNDTRHCDGAASGGEPAG